MRPLKLLPSVAIFASFATLLWGMTHFAIPYLSHKFDIEPIVFWFICGGLGVFLPLILTGIIMISRERKYLRNHLRSSRLRFKKMNLRDWIYTIMGLIAIGALNYGIMLVMQKIVPNFSHTPPFMQFEPLSEGRYWILALWLPYWILNIGGEEFFWRGVMFPRQELAFGKHTWAVHATGWSIFHLAFGWQLLIMLLPLLYIQSYVVQRTSNNSCGLFLHAIINGPSFIAISLGAM